MSQAPPSSRVDSGTPNAGNIDETSRLPRICAVGDNVIDQYPGRGVQYPGGNAVNVAVHAARSGALASYVGRVGSDAAGQQILEALETEGVDCTRLLVVPGETARVTIELCGGERDFRDWTLGVSTFTLDEADLRHLAQFDLVHTGEASGLDEQMETVSRVVPVSYDFSDRDLNSVRHVLPYVSIAFFSRSSESLAEIHQFVDEILASGPEIVVVTRGAAGSIARSRGQAFIDQPVEEIEVIDTLGAGDSYIAAFLSTLLTTDDVSRAALSGARHAANTCTFIGAFGDQYAQELAAHVPSKVPN
ncbi:PfkB family carbohydrate kinase [Arthrobacter sedimenti]|uniref:PfkB family carbohydrate kinase n=1 Tax=Arthrobacter sedimenti TaxID=2694931 RepID=UPI00141E0891|nr:PfkB family carbohydrate kinase [Arthrobacter sedimenti]